MGDTDLYEQLAQVPPGQSVIVVVKWCSTNHNVDIKAHSI